MPPTTSQVVALANLLPEAQETDDLDSYMYQTVGHSLGHLFGHSLVSPLTMSCVFGILSVRHKCCWSNLMQNAAAA